MLCKGFVQVTRISAHPSSNNPVSTTLPLQIENLSFITPPHVFIRVYVLNSTRFFNKFHALWRGSFSLFFWHLAKCKSWLLSPSLSHTHSQTIHKYTCTLKHNHTLECASVFLIWAYTLYEKPVVFLAFDAFCNAGVTPGPRLLRNPIELFKNSFGTLLLCIHLPAGMQSFCFSLELVLHLLKPSFLWMRCVWLFKGFAHGG